MKKSSGQSGFNEVYIDLKKKEYPNLYKLFQKTEAKNTSQLILEGQYYTDTNTGQIHYKNKENYRPITLMNVDAKTLNKILATKPSIILKGLYTKTEKCIIYPRNGKVVQLVKIYVIQHFNRKKGKKHLIDLDSMIGSETCHMQRASVSSRKFFHV